MCATNKSQGYLPTQETGFFKKKNHIPMLLIDIWNEPETCQYEWSQVDTRKEKKKFQNIDKSQAHNEGCLKDNTGR